MEGAGYRPKRFEVPMPFRIAFHLVSSYTGREGPSFCHSPPTHLFFQPRKHPLFSRGAHFVLRTRWGGAAQAPPTRGHACLLDAVVAMLDSGSPPPTFFRGVERRRGGCPRGLRRDPIHPPHVTPRPACARDQRSSGFHVKPQVSILVASADSQPFLPGVSGQVPRFAYL